MPLTENDQQKQQASKSGNGKKKTLVALRNAITYFTDARSSAKYRGNLNLHLALENIEQSSRSSGLTPPHILKLVKSITTGKWTEIVSSRLIRSLIPAAHVPHNAVVFAVSSLSAKNISDNMKCLFVRWMVLIYEYVDNKDTLHSLYGILFLFLDSDILCVHICRLLYLMTQRGDVKQYRVRKLLDIQSKVGVQPHIMALLSVYKLYSPNMVTVSSRIGNQSYFKQSDQKWAQIIHLVQEKNKRLNEDEDEAEDANEPSSRALDVHQPRKRRKLDVIPVLETIDRNERVPQSVKSLRKRMVPLEQIENFKQLLQNIDVVVLPNRIASILQSPHLYHVLTLFPDKTIAPRLSYWIHVSLYREIIAYPKSGENPKATALLQVITDFTDHLQESIPVCEWFLNQYLHTWNGLDYRIHILNLITRMPICSFEKMNDLLLEPLRKLYFCSGVYFKCLLLWCFTELLRNLMSVEVPRHRRAVAKQQETNIAESTILLNDTIFGQQTEQISTDNTIVEFINFVDNICVVGLQVEKNNALLMSYVLDFFHVTSGLYSRHGFKFLQLPSSPIVKRALYGNSAVFVSKINELLCRYSDEVNLMKESQAEYVDILKEKIPIMNNYVLCVCNALWQSKAFKNAKFQNTLSAIETYLPSSRRANASFSVLLHPALQMFVKKQQELNQTHSTPRTRELAILNSLKSHDLDGIYTFATTFVGRYARK